MSRPSQAGDSRRPRADAERNRAHILRVARTLFTERGDMVQMSEIARAAGVGVGTVYRHFPSRTSLVEALAEHRFAEIEEFARAQLLDDRSGRGLARYLEHVGEVLDSDRGLSAAIETARGRAGSEPRDESRTRLEAVVSQLIAQGRAAGTLRDDCTVDDVYLLTGCLSAAIRTNSGDWRRLLELAWNGLRPR